MSDFELPVTHYALSGDVNIAYQTMGNGPIDMVIVPGVVSHVEFAHEIPGYTAFLRGFSSFARVVTFDKRGQGLSDRVSDAPSLEQRMDDVRAIMDAVGRHSHPQAPLGSDHSRHCGSFPGSPSSVSGPATWRSIVPIDGPQCLSISPRVPQASAPTASGAEGLDEFHRMATPGNKSTMTAYQTPVQSL